MGFGSPLRGTFHHLASSHSGRTSWRSSEAWSCGKKGWTMAGRLLSWWRGLPFVCYILLKYCHWESFTYKEDISRITKITLAQWFLTRDNSVLQGTLGSVWRCFWKSRLGTGVLLALSGWGPEGCSRPQCLGQLPQRTTRPRIPDVRGAKGGERSALAHFNALSQVGGEGLRTGLPGGSGT